MRFKEGIKVLKSLSVSEKDFKQIQRVLRHTKYFKFENGKTTRISADTAISILGENAFWSGVSRSAFHWSAERRADAGTHILFDSSAFFTNKTEGGTIT